MQEMFKKLVNPKIEAIGLEIGTSAIKIVELKAGLPPTLRALALRPTPPGTLQDGQVIEPQAIAAEIKAGLAEAKIRNRYCVTAVANQSAITRIIQMPKMSLKDLDEAIKWEAERYIPFPIDEVVLDYDVLDNIDELADDAQMEVMIAAAQHEVVARLVEVIKLAGLEPVVIDVKPFAALRALRGSLLGEHLNKTTLSGTNFTAEGEVGVVLEIGASNSTIALVRGERVLMNLRTGFQYRRGSQTQLRHCDHPDRRRRRPARFRCQPRTVQPRQNLRRDSRTTFGPDHRNSPFTRVLPCAIR
jgi:type IV pilus assembly protein PilM